MQGKKPYSEKLFNSFQLSERVPKENIYRRLKEALDLKFLYQRTSKLYGETGHPSIDPVVFFKLMLIGYLENITSDRRLLMHCSMRLDLLYFLNYDIDEELPWHSTLSRTRQLYDEKLFEELFSKVFSLCVESGMVSGHTHAIDSAYIKANASMDSIELKQPVQSIREFVAKSGEENFTPLRPSQENKASAAQKTLSASSQELSELNTRNKRFEEKKKEQHGASAAHFISFSNKTHYSPTDPEARISTKPGKPRQLNYVCNLSVDTGKGVISHVQADYADVKDSRYLQELTTKTKLELKKNNLEIENILADTGYTSAGNYHELEKQNITAYIPVSGKFKSMKQHGEEGFSYDKAKDCFICGNKKELRFKKSYTDTKGLEKKRYLSRARDCKVCPLRTACLGAKGKVKKIETSLYQGEMERAYARQHSSRGKRMMRVRAGTVEPVFGNLINYYGLRKINVKGKSGAHKVMLMSAIAYNLKKLMKHLNRKRETHAQSMFAPVQNRVLLTGAAALSTIFRMAAAAKRCMREKLFVQYQLP